MNDEIRARVDNLKQGISALKTVSDTIAEVGITIEDKPTDMPSRPGYRWVPHQAALSRGLKPNPRIRPAQRSSR